MRLALIVSYFERPDLLDLCMTAIEMQTRKPDELIIIDDGSEIPPPFKGNRYIRHEHVGFRKDRLANRAIAETDCDYLVFLDQDCIVQPNFLQIHEAIAKPNYYICAMYTSLTKEETRTVVKESIEDQSIWQQITRAYGGYPHVWCGAGSAVWRKDALAVNGFDNRLGLVGPDINFGLRLSRLGLGWDHFSYYSRYLHLWHEKPYALNSVDKANALFHAREWAKEGARTPFGIETA
jgi:GT2 family glycosyltransferase